MSERAKPFVSAFLCERVLTEADGVQTYVRVVDSFTAQVASGGRARFPVWLAVIVKSGEAKGQYSLTFRMHEPNGNTATMGTEIPVPLEGGEHGINANIQILIDVEQEGLYYIDLLLNGEMSTRVPFRVRLESPAPAQSTRRAPDR